MKNLILPLVLAFSFTEPTMAKLYCDGQDRKKNEVTRKMVNECKTQLRTCNSKLFRGSKGRRTGRKIGINCRRSNSRRSKNICNSYHIENPTQRLLTGTGECVRDNMLLIAGQLMDVQSTSKAFLQWLWRMAMSTSIGYDHRRAQQAAKTNIMEVFNLEAWQKGSAKYANRYRWSCYTPEVRQRIACMQITIDAVRYMPAFMSVAAAALTMDLTAFALEFQKLLRLAAIGELSKMNDGFKAGADIYLTYAALAAPMQQAMNDQMASVDSPEELKEWLDQQLTAKKGLRFFLKEAARKRKKELDDLRKSQR